MESNFLIASAEPLRQRNLATYLSGQAISLVGVWLQVTAQGWLAWELCGSAAALGIAAALATLPLLVLVPVMGPIANRYDRRELIKWNAPFPQVFEGNRHRERQ